MELRGINLSGVNISTGGGGGSLPIPLDTIAAYLRPYLATVSTSGGLRNPYFWDYTLDGDEYFVSDGGNDMLDGGNYTAPFLLSEQTFYNDNDMNIPPALSYAQTTTDVTDTNFYYVSLGYASNRVPLTMLGTRSGIGNPIGFQKAGNLGSDGGGSWETLTVYGGVVLNNFTTWAFSKQSWGQSTDPACCDIYILLGHPSWNSTFGTIGSGVSSSPTQYQGASLYTYGAGVKNVLAITTMIAKDPGNIQRKIENPTQQEIVQNYTYLIGQALGI